MDAGCRGLCHVAGQLVRKATCACRREETRANGHTAAAATVGPRWPAVFAVCSYGYSCRLQLILPIKSVRDALVRQLMHDEPHTKCVGHGRAKSTNGGSQVQPSPAPHHHNPRSHACSPAHRLCAWFFGALLAGCRRAPAWMGVRKGSRRECVVRSKLCIEIQRIAGFSALRRPRPRRAKSPHCGDHGRVPRRA